MKRLLTTLIAILSIFIIGVLIIFGQSMSSYRAARDNAFSHAEKYADLEDPDNFYWYNGTDTYYTVTGTTGEEEDIVAIIQKEGGHIDILPLSETISEHDAVQQALSDLENVEILETRIGKDEDLPIWEISFQNSDGTIGYYLVALETGEWLKSVDNL